MRLTKVNQKVVRLFFSDGWEYTF